MPEKEYKTQAQDWLFYPGKDIWLMGFEKIVGN